MLPLPRFTSISRSYIAAVNPLPLPSYIPLPFDPPLDVLRVSDVVLGDVLEAVVSAGWYRSKQIETKEISPFFFLILILILPF